MQTFAQSRTSTAGPNGHPRIRVIDSHTGGEPTRIVVEGAPDLGPGDMHARRDVLRERFDWLRTSLVTEPRGAEWMVGAVLQPPVDPACAAGVIFFNNVGYLGMCGHGLIGTMATLRFLGRVEPGLVHIETPVGIVAATLANDGTVSVDNVPSRRTRHKVVVDVAGYGPMTGDVAWGGNWFFLAHVDEAWMHAPLERLAALTNDVRQALAAAGVTGDDGTEIDHVELFGEPSSPGKANSRSYVMCPGGHYDRSPCGTGTSAKLACLAADGVLAPGAEWRQESIIGSVFRGSYRPTEQPGVILPTISGQAFVTGDVTLVIDPQDPFGVGIPSMPGAQAT
jgi:4-hydroxyproline epimerase